MGDGRLILSELFGPTIQGEGPSAGTPALFVRLGLCNLDCHACDTPYTWDWTGKNGTAYDRRSLAHTTVEHVAAWAAQTAAGARLVVITGGEPLVQAQGVLDLIAALYAEGLAVEVETNGTLPPLPDGSGVAYNVSPKLDAMLADARNRERPDALAAFTRLTQDPVAWKFVVASPDDLAALDGFVARHHLPADRVWLMPEGTDAHTQLARMRWLANAAIARGYRLTTRLHVLLWGNERGR